MCTTTAFAARRHYCPRTICLAAQQQVVLFTLPPNTTHLLQPLDRSCFGPLKVTWREVCHHYFMSSNPGKSVTKFQFSELFNEAWLQSMTVANITAGFRITGIYPLNRSVVPFQSPECENLTKETGLNFL